MDNNELKKKYNLKGSPTSGLTIATFGLFVGFAAVSLFGPASKSLNESMEMSGLLLGILVAAPNLSGSLLRIPFGAWVDKVGGKIPFLTLLSLSIVGMVGLTTILFLYYPDNLTLSMYPIIFFFGLLSGCGIATFSVGIPQTSYWFPQEKQGIALGTYAGLGNTAPGIFGMILPLALISWGLTASYAAWVVVLVLGTIIYAVFARDAYYFQLVKKGMEKKEAVEVATRMGQEFFPSGKVKESLIIAAKVPGTWGLVLLYFTSFGGFLALTTWFITYWVNYHGIELRQAGLLMALGFSLLAAFVRVYGGHISDKYGGERTAIVSYVIVLVGASILIFASSFIVALIGEIIIGTGMGAANAAVFKLVPKYVPKAPGGASGLVGGLGAFGGFVVPPILGLFTDIYGDQGYANGFIVYVILAISAIIISYILMRKYSKPIST